MLTLLVLLNRQGLEAAIVDYEDKLRRIDESSQTAGRHLEELHISYGHPQLPNLFTHFVLDKIR